jgi:DNA polymerase III alpha subunit
MIPLFKSHFSIGKSILTLDDPKDVSDGGSDSIFKIALDNGLKQIFLVEDSLVGFFEAYKKSKQLNIQLIFGLRLSMRNSALDEDECSEHKIIIFARNDEGCKLLNKIYSKAFCDFKGFLDYVSLKNFWNKDHLMMAIPFYDSFIHVNNFNFGNAIPDLSFATPVFFLENNNLALDDLLRKKILEFVNQEEVRKLEYKTENTKTIYYKDKKDAASLMVYKIICNRSFGKNRTLEKPELPHFCSNEFSFESWRENAKIR